MPQFTLEGLRDLQRLIEVKGIRMAADMDAKLQEECALIQQEIQSRMTGRDASLSSFVRVNSGEKTVYLQYEMGTNDKGKRQVTARDYHNPASPKYGGMQPFQQALLALGYEDIEPDYGASIPVSHGEAPGIRLKAKMGPDVIKRLTR